MDTLIMLVSVYTNESDELKNVTLFMNYSRSDYVIIHSTSTMKESLNSLQVEVNGCKYTISNIDPKTSLNEWLHGQPGLKGDI